MSIHCCYSTLVFLPSEYLESLFLNQIQWRYGWHQPSVCTVYRWRLYYDVEALWVYTAVISRSFFFRLSIWSPCSWTKYNCVMAGISLHFVQFIGYACTVTWRLYEYTLLLFHARFSFVWVFGVPVLEPNTMALWLASQSFSLYSLQDTLAWRGGSMSILLLLFHIRFSIWVFESLFLNQIQLR